MNQSTNQPFGFAQGKPFNLAKLAKALSTLRRKIGISLNQLAKLVGVSRRTLERIEKRNSKSETRSPRLWARTAYKLAKTLLGEEETERRLEEQTRLSRFLGNDPLYKYLDDIYHYPAFLFHDSVGQPCPPRGVRGHPPPRARPPPR